MRQHFIGTMRLPQKSRHPGRGHAIETFLLHVAGAQKNNDVGLDVAKPDKSFFAIHERHREIEHDKIEKVRTFAKNIEAFEAGLRRCNFKSGFRKNPFCQDQSHRFVIHHQETMLSPQCRLRRSPGLGEGDQIRMERLFLAGPSRLFDKLRRDFRGAGDTRSEHFKILFRTFPAPIKTFEDGTRPGNDFQKIVQFAGRGGGGVAGLGIVAVVGVHAAKSVEPVNTGVSVE